MHRIGGIYQDINKIGKEYKNGRTLRELAEKWRWSEMTIMRALKKTGIITRPTGPRLNGHIYNNKQLNKLFEKQNFKCAICELNGISNKMCADHDHSTGYVRGIVCHGCNLLVGVLETNGTRYNDAVHYLANNKTKIKYHTGI